MKEIKFAENLKTLRRAKNLSQAALAKLVGVDQRTVSAWENGICEPNYSILLLLSDIFDETVDDILT